MKRATLAACFVFVMSSAAFAELVDKGGTTFEKLGDTLTIVTLPSEKIKREIEEKKEQRAALQVKIARQIEEAREKSARVLSKDELAKIKAQADAVLEKARREVERLDAEIAEAEKAGAMIFCSSQIIGEVKP